MNQWTEYEVCTMWDEHFIESSPRAVKRLIFWYQGHRDHPTHKLFVADLHVETRACPPNWTIS